MAITFEHWQSISNDTELKAAAAAAFILGARLERLDIPPAQGMRDIDLIAAAYSSGSSLTIGSVKPPTINANASD